MLRLVKLENRSLFAFAAVALDKPFAFAVAACRCAAFIAFGDGVPFALAKLAHFEAFPVAGKSFPLAVAACRCAAFIAFGDGVPFALAKVAHFEAFPVAGITRLCGFDEVRVGILPQFKGDWFCVHGFTILKPTTHTHGLDSHG